MEFQVFIISNHSFRNNFTFVVIIGYQARVSAGVLAIFCIATAFYFTSILLIKCKQSHFLKAGLAGGFLFIVANGTKDWSVDREKKYVRL